MLVGIEPNIADVKDQIPNHLEDSTLYHVWDSNP